MTAVMIITGGSRGIGAATACLAARKGFDVCISYIRDAAAAASVVSKVEATGRRAIAIQSDVGNEADIVALFQAVDRQLGRVSALVNNAAVVATGRRRVEAMQGSEINRMMQANVTGTILCTREAILRMSTRHGGPGGAIVNVSSASARLGAANLWMDYAASKGAVDAFTFGVAQEVADEGIRVNAVRPGLIDTEVHAATGMPDRAQRVAKYIPMKRAGKPEEVAETIVWLASAAASYVSGTIVDVAGAR